MTGRINCLNTSSSGFIQAENGVRAHFDTSVLLAYDAARLAVGQAVTFDLKGGRSSEAVNVCVQRSLAAVPSEQSRPDSTHFRYMGFDQRANMRAYRFERTSPGHATRMFVLTTDLALFTKHHVAIQEGPALCLHLLTAELDTPSAAAPRLPQSALTDQDLLTHLASRPVPATRRHPRFVPRRSAHARGTPS